MVNSLPAGIELELRGGRGADTMEIGDRDLDSNIRGLVRAIGGLGFDTLRIRDSSDANGNDSYNLLGNSISKTNLPHSISYSSFGHVQLYANPQPNEITLVQPIPGTNVTFYGNGGDDTLFLSSTNLESLVSLIGQTGNDTIRVVNTHIASTGGVSLSGESGDDRLESRNVSGDFGSYLNLSGGSNSDVMIVNGASGGLDINLSGSNGHDSLRVLDAQVSQQTDLSAGPGNDFIRLGGGDISSNLTGSYFVRGNEGNDHPCSRRPKRCQHE